MAEVANIHSKRIARSTTTAHFIERFVNVEGQWTYSDIAGIT